MASVAETAVAVPPRRKRGPVLHFLGRLFREKPLGAAGAVVFVLFLFCGSARQLREEVVNLWQEGLR